MSVQLECWPRDEQEISLGTGSGNSASLGYFVRGTDVEYVAFGMVQSLAPSGYFGLLLNKIELKKLGWLLWEGTASYGDPDKNKDPDDPVDTFSVDTTGGTHKLTQTLKRVFMRGRIMPTGSDGQGGKEFKNDFSGAIGVKGNDVEGCEIVIPTLKFSIKRTVRSELITTGQIKTWSRVTGKTNSKPFKEFAAGELLFLGVTVNGKLIGAVDVEFHFAANENIDETITIGGIENTHGKKGWEYLWCYYAPTADGENSMIAPKPLGVYVDKVYEEIDFGILGLGGSSRTHTKKVPRAY